MRTKFQKRNSKKKEDGMKESRIFGQSEVGNELDHHTFINIAMQCFKAGELEFGLKMCEKAIAIDPEASFAHYIFAELLEYEGNYEKALLHVNMAIQLSPSLYFYYMLRGKINLRLSHYEKALQDFKTGKKIIPAKSAYHFHAAMGFTFCLMNKINNALKELNKSIKLNPEFEAAYFIRSIVYKSLGKHLEAENDIKFAENLVETNQQE